jgi:hypothetical protein
MPTTISGSTGLNLSGSGNQVTFPDSSVQTTSATGFGFKNRLINGAMVIDQRNGGASVTPSGVQYITDRWAAYEDTDGTMTFQQSSTTATGFTKSIVATTTSADSSLSATQRVIFLQRIEGFNIADLGWGTLNAQTVTLSFWVRSSLTGTFGGSLGNVGVSNRSYPFTYTISSANTFEYKTVTIAGDTTGTWDSTNGIGIQVCFGLGVGTTFSGTAGAWASADYNSATGATSVIGTNGATWYLTGVQLEVGSTATSFDFRDYGRELILCQRYFQQFGGTTTYEYIGDCICASSTIAYAGISLTTTMRTAPSFAFTGAATDFTTDAGTSNTQCTALSLNAGAVNKVRLSLTSSGLTSGTYRTFLTFATSTSKVQFSAEL